jgi:hypothetical protein
MARPRKDDEIRRSAYFAVRLTPAEREALFAEAGRLAISPTELARQRLTRGRVLVQEHPQLDPRQVFELGKIGVNLNQIARALNSRQNINPATIEAGIDELKALIAAILRPGEPLPISGDGGADAGPDITGEPAPTRPKTRPRGGASIPPTGASRGS